MNDALIHLNEIATRFFDSRQDLDYDGIKVEYQNECERIILTLVTKASEMEPYKAKSLLNQAQFSIINHLQTFTTSEPVNNKMADERFSFICTQLNSMLAILHFRFTDLIDKEQAIPTVLLRAKIDEYLSQFDFVFGETSNDDEISEVYDLLKVIFQVEGQFTSVAKLNYLHEKLSKIYHWAKELDHEKTKLDFMLFLVSINLNHPKFYLHFCKYIMGENAKASDFIQQHQNLVFLLKLVKQILQQPGQSYNPSQPPIQQSIIRFIKAELGYMKTIDALASDMSKNRILDQHYKVSFTVKQLAIFFSLQVEAGIIIADKPMHVHQHAVRHYRTQDVDAFSEKSFKNGYYGGMSNDFEKVIEKLVDMLGIAQNKY